MGFPGRDDDDRRRRDDRDERDDRDRVYPGKAQRWDDGDRDELDEL